MPTATATAETVIDPHRWYSVQVVAQLLSLTDECIRQRCKSGSLPAARIPTDGGQGQWRIKGEDVLQVLGKMELARGGSGIVERPTNTGSRRGNDDFKEYERIRGERRKKADQQQGSRR